jgi:hypothetical protein
VLILAILRQGKGAWSQTAFYSTAASVPSAPENLKTACSGAGDAAVVGKLVLEWDTPCSNGATILGYVLELCIYIHMYIYTRIYNIYIYIQVPLFWATCSSCIYIYIYIYTYVYIHTYI